MHEDYTSGATNETDTPMPAVLGGEAAGEADADPTNQFFVSKKAAAVLKHAVLDQYLVPFAAKIGKFAVGQRVVYIDGYAGPGRYTDGTPGSPALVLEQAASVAAFRKLECLFVERNRADFRRLHELVDQAKTNGIACEAYHGSIDRRLDELLSRAGNSPLFVFLDPFGLGLPFGDLTQKVLGGSRGPTGAKTEVLINFSANATRRIGGFLRPDCRAKNRETTLAAMDRTCGGDWWRSVYAAHDTNETRVEAIATCYAQRVAKVTHAGYWTSSVRNRAANQPVYHLVFFSRHPDGLWLFGDALARAQQRWRRVLDPPPCHDDYALFDLPDTFEQEEKSRTSEWKEELKRNIVHILDREGDFCVADRYTEVFGAALGLAPDRILREAVKELYRDGRTACPGTGRPSRFRITRPVCD